MKTAHRAQSIDNRLKRIVWLSIACVLASAVLCLAYSKAASWDTEDTLRSYLTDNYPWEAIEVSNVQAPGNISDEAPVDIIVEKGPLGKAVFTLLFSNNERMTVKADVRAFGTVLMSKRALQRRHIIEDDDLYITKVDIEKMPKSSVKDPEKILGKSLKRSITANMPVEEDMIEMSQLVERGKSVVLLIDYNGIIVTAAGKTKAKSYVGMSVNAINMSSKKEVRGVLINENTVKVEL